MKVLGVFTILVGAALGFFSIVETSSGFTIVPKASFTFVDTFISVDDVIRRYNNKNFSEVLRGDPQLDNIVRNLENRGYISSSNNPESEAKSSNRPDSMEIGRHSKIDTPSPPRAVPAEEIISTREALYNNFNDDTYDDLLTILSNLALHCSFQSTCDTNGFTLKRIDINSDGSNEFLVTHGSYCGSGGCTTVLMAQDSDHKWTPLAGNFGDINLLTGSTKGYQDIQYSYKTYTNLIGPLPWYMAAQKFSWSGREYVQNGGIEPVADYNDLKAVIFDASNAVGNTIYVDAAYRELGMRNGLPTMLINVETETDLRLWYVFFDSTFNDEVASLKPGQRLSIFCQIKELSRAISQCDLVTMTKKD